MTELFSPDDTARINEELRDEVKHLQSELSKRNRALLAIKNLAAESKHYSIQMTHEALLDIYGRAKEALE